MKYVRTFMVFLFFLLILNLKTISFAMNTGLSTEIIPDDEVQTILSRFDISMLTIEHEKRPIECFDVNEKGMIAVGYSSSFISNEKNICVYSNDGTFLYGYQFDDSGSFAVEWDEDRLIIYFVRSGLAVAVNKTGEIEAIEKIQNTIDNNSYWNHTIRSKKRVVGDTTYRLKNNMGALNLVASSYSQVVVEKADGVKTVIYDATTYHLITLIILIIVALTITCIAIIGVIREWIKQNKLYNLKHKPS